MNIEENKIEATNIENEVIPSMDEFKDEINKSFKAFKEGDIINGTIISITDTEIILDLESYTEGIIPIAEVSNDPAFLPNELSIGDKISALVIKEDDSNGNLILSKKKADDILAWDELEEFKDNKTIINFKISAAVNAGVIGYLKGIRAFIPASQLSISYVDNLEDWVGKNIDINIITAERNDKKLILSGKEVELKMQAEDKNSKMAKLQIGIVTKGVVETIMPYGAFIKLENGLSGLVHISQIAHHRIKSPNEVLKVGDEVNVKIIALKDGKISLSIKDIEEKEDIIESFNEVTTSYSSGEATTTDLGSLLKNIKL